MRPLLLIAPVLLATPALAQETGEIKYFGDWVVGCDNRWDCTAIGLAPEAAPAPAYLKITRAAGAESGPDVSVAILDDAGEGGTIELSLTGGEALPVTELDAEPGEASIVSAALGPVDHVAFIDALLPAEALDVSLGGTSVPVSLTGISAALRYMDAMQERAGPSGALVARGERPADTIPPTPPAVTVDAMSLSEISEPGERPEGLPESDEYCPEAAGDYVLEAEDGTRLWGVCSSAGAYNISYDFSIVRDGEATPADFGPQGQGMSPDSDQRSTLVNPQLWDDGRSFGTFARGRGIGDCGSIARFALTADGPALVEQSVMGECRGVSAEDWPVLYRAELSSE
jgi:hypothetical protein